MSRLFFVILIIALVVYLFKRSSLPKPPLDSSKKSTSKTGEAMMRCKTCGVHLPVSEALLNQEDYFCSASHLPPE